MKTQKVRKMRKIHKGGWFDLRSFFRWRPSWSFFSRSRPASFTETHTQESDNTSNDPDLKLYKQRNARKLERGLRIETSESRDREKKEREEDEERQKKDDERIQIEKYCGDIPFKRLTHSEDNSELLKNIEKSSNVDLFKKYRFYIPIKGDRPINNLFNKDYINYTQTFSGDLKDDVKIFIVSGIHTNKIGTFIKKEVVVGDDEYECNYVIKVDDHAEVDGHTQEVRVNIKDLVLFDKIPVAYDGGKTKRKKGKSCKKKSRRKRYRQMSHFQN